MRRHQKKERGYKGEREEREKIIHEGWFQKRERGWDAMAWWKCVLDYERWKNQIEALNLFNLGASENQPGSYGDSPQKKACSYTTIILHLLSWGSQILTPCIHPWLPNFWISVPVQLKIEWKELTSGYQLLIVLTKDIKRWKLLFIISIFSLKNGYFNLKKAGRSWSQIV